MQNGIAYLLNLQRVLELNNIPFPEAITVTDEMFNSIEHAYPALVIDHEYERVNGEGFRATKGTVIKFHGMKIYRGSK